ncbi:protein FAM149A [Spea bombifrons]|uniref:protein FAM149A n=1 Tax=Spea bombifrons TaxID=233779 RepID=UPI00234B2306|nr:protein FAM149A [Spea bombifrons]
MKVAVLDLGTIFAKIFKSSVSPINPVPAPGNSFSGPVSSTGPTNIPVVHKTPFLLLPAPPSPLNIIHSATSSTSSLPRVSSGKSITHLGGLSAPGSPSQSSKPQASNSAANTLETHFQQPYEESWTGPDSTAVAPVQPTTIFVRPALSNTSLIMPILPPGHSTRSPRLLQDSLTSGWNTKSMLLTLPDIGEESTDYEDSHHSQGKGISRVNTDACISEDDGDPLPAHFTRPVQEAICNYTCESISSLSSSGQTTPTDLNQSWSGIQSYTTGLSTERSSVYSWRDDEFDKANTLRVHQLFWDVDEMMFEGNVTSQTKNLQAECKEWTKRSLHLRILGKQLIFPMDDGFQHFQSRTPSSVYTSSFPSLVESSSDLGQLCISGSKLVPTVSPLQKEYTYSGSSLTSDSSVYSFLEEEIYDVDGNIEEYLAYDSKDYEDEGLDQKKAHLHRKRNKRGIPPVSPNACIKDTVAAEVFDDAWRNIVELMQDVVLRSWESASDEIKQGGKLQPSRNVQIPVPRMVSEVPSVPPSRGSETRSMSFGTYALPSQGSRNFYSDLNGVMTIQAKPLQHRHGGLAEKTHEQEDKTLNVVPSILTSARNRLGRLTDNSVLSASRMLQTPSRKTPTQRRLPSLSLDPLRSKTPNVYSDEVLRGTKLYTGLERLCSPSIQANRNKLPPINSEAVEQHLSVPGSRHSAHRGRYLHSRVSSAVPDTTGRRPLRERTVVVEQFSRPNTTHTFRSEASYRRSFTPLDFANNTWTGQTFLTSSQYQPKSLQRNPPNARRKFQVP